MSNNENEHRYRVDLAWKEDRIGIMSSPELEDRIEVATPPEFEGGVEGIWSPEHLFVSSVSSCFMTTFVAIAQYSKLKFEDLDVKAVGKIEKVDGKFMVTEITLEPELVITEEKFQDKAKRIMEKAESACLITRSIKTEIHFKPKVTVASLK